MRIEAPISKLDGVVPLFTYPPPDNSTNMHSRHSSHYILKICPYLGFVQKGEEGVQPKSKLFEAFFSAWIWTIFRVDGGGVDPNRNTFEALFFLNLDIMRTKFFFF